MDRSATAPGSSDSADAARRYRINETNLAARRQLIGFTAADVRTLAQLAPWIRRNLTSIIAEFYDRQFAAVDSRAYLENYAAKKGRDVGWLRAHLERMLEGYLTGIFAEAERGGTYGVAYFSNRLHVGQVHNEINLPVKLVIGAFGAIGDVLRGRLVRRLPFAQPALNGALHAVDAILNYEMQAIVDAFIFDYFESSGVRLERLSAGQPDADLSGVLDEIKGTIRTTIAQTISGASRLGDLSSSLAAAAEETHRAIEEVGSGVNGISAGARTQGDATRRTQASVDALVGLADDSARNAAQVADRASTSQAQMQQIAEAIDRTSAAARAVEDATRAAAAACTQGLQAIRGSIEGMVRIRASVEQSGSSVGELGRKSDHIGTIVETISEIAEQTNLLALNAAIEAARAGNAGRGFSVVADEVRKLAERAKRAASEIGSLIGEVRQETRSAVAAMDAGSREVEAGVARADDANSALDAITTAIEGMLRSAEHISAAMAALEADRAAMLERMKEIAAISGAHGADAQEMNRRAFELAEAMPAISEEAERNCSAASSLGNAIGEISSSAAGVVQAAYQLAELGQQMDAVVAQLHVPDAPGEEPSAAPPPATDARTAVYAR
jgi:methyl-accepting chemotaxis protein